MIGVKLFVCVAVLVALTSAYPAVDDIDVEQQLEDQEIYQPDANEAINVESKTRSKRATCDLLSFGGRVNHSACASHCIIKGFRGGWCNSQAVCNCRR